MAHSSFTSFLRQRPTVAGTAAVVLAAGLAFVVYAPSNNNVVTHQVQTQDGRSRLIQTGSGAQTGSGDLTAGDQKTGSGWVRVEGSAGSCLILKTKAGATNTIKIDGGQIKTGTGTTC